MGRTWKQKFVCYELVYDLGLLNIINNDPFRLSFVGFVVSYRPKNLNKFFGPKISYMGLLIYQNV